MGTTKPGKHVHPETGPATHGGHGHGYGHGPGYGHGHGYGHGGGHGQGNHAATSDRGSKKHGHAGASRKAFRRA